MPKTKNLPAVRDIVEPGNVADEPADMVQTVEEVRELAEADQLRRRQLLAFARLLALDKKQWLISVFEPVYVCLIYFSGNEFAGLHVDAVVIGKRLAVEVALH